MNMRRRLSGEITINFDTYTEDVNLLIEKFNKLTLLLNNFDLKNKESVHNVQVQDYSMKWLTVEDVENGDITDIEYHKRKQKDARRKSNIK